MPTETVKGRLCIRGLRLRFFSLFYFVLLYLPLVLLSGPDGRTARVSAECNDDARVTRSRRNDNERFLGVLFIGSALSGYAEEGKVLPCLPPPSCGPFFYEP